MGRYIIRTFVGGAIAAIFGPLLLGEDFYLGIFCAVVLSCGLALLVILPVLYFLGFLATFWWLDRESEPKDTGQGRVYAPSPWSGGVSLKSYIGKARARGFSDERIIQALKSVGWQEDEVREAIKEMNNDPILTERTS